MNYILKIFNKIAELNNIKTNEKNMINYINTERKKDFGKIKDKFVNENKLNPHFKMKYEILFPKEEDVSSFSSIQEIFDNSNYKYGFYELQKLSKLTKINTILLGNKIGNRIPDDNGMRCFYNKSNIYLLLNIDPVKDYDKYNIIIKNRQKILFNYDDFNKSFKETIIDRKCKGEVIDNNDN